MKTYIQDPNDTLDYTEDWADWLGTDTIVTSTWILPTSPDSTLVLGTVADPETQTATSTTVWLAGGTVGRNYLVINRIVTVGEREKDRTIMLKIRQQ